MKTIQSTRYWLPSRCFKTKLVQESWTGCKKSPDTAAHVCRWWRVYCMMTVEGLECLFHLCTSIAWNGFIWFTSSTISQRFTRMTINWAFIVTLTQLYDGLNQYFHSIFFAQLAANNTRHENIVNLSGFIRIKNEVNSLMMRSTHYRAFEKYNSLRLKFKISESILFF